MKNVLRRKTGLVGVVALSILRQISCHHMCAKLAKDASKFCYENIASHHDFAGGPERLSMERVTK